MLLNKINFKKIASPSQRGMASIVVVTMLIVLLSLITLGFARLMNRALGNSLNNQLASAAYYAARSAINDAAAYLASNPTANVTSCNDPSLSDLYNSGNLSGDQIVRYTCILINQTAADLDYQNLEAFKSQVIRLRASNGNIDSLLIGWESNSSSNNNPANMPNLYSQSQWGANGYLPVLRVVLYPITSIAMPLNSVQAMSKTYFLYPSASGGAVQSINFSTQVDGSLVETRCNNTAAPPYNTSAVHICNLVIGNLQSTGAIYYYLRITPLYQAANVNIQGRAGNASTIAQFSGTQATIDVTAKANDAVKRLSAKVDTSALGSEPDNISGALNAMPEFSIRSAATLCKRLNVAAGATAIDASAVAYCNLTIP